uniref:Restriction modification system DNA specificity domain n=1 Tax=Methanococcus maripaludis (strain C6 / ATCC BAA-1332) TaxID=444158 RepID=A9A7U6_METM6
MKDEFKDTEIGKIPVDWEVKEIGELVTFQRGHDLPVNSRKNGIYPVVASNGIVGYHNEYKVENEGLTIGRSGNLGEPFYVSTSFWPLNTTLYVKKFHNSHPKFMYYFLKTLDLKKYNSGSAVPSLNRNYIHPIKVAVPPLHEQQKIAQILSSLDDKIENNNQQNKILEETANSIFKEWFVNFNFLDENGLSYFENNGEMEFNEDLGSEIPKGWKVGSIYEISEVIYGAPFSSKLFNECGDGYPLIRIRDLKTLNPSFFTTEQHAKGTLIYPGNIVAGMDAEFRPYFWLGNIGYLNQRVCTFKPKYEWIHNYFIYETIKEPLNFFEKSKVGTTVIHLGKSDIDTFKIIVPDEVTLKNFYITIDPIFDKIIENSKQNRYLSNLRDLLLPKLMSGEIRLK